MADTKELKPCPFCGGKAELTQIGKKKIKVKCTLCHIQITQAVRRFSVEWLEDKMIEDWNKRTTQ